MAGGEQACGYKPLGPFCEPVGALVMAASYQQWLCASCVVLPPDYHALASRAAAPLFWTGAVQSVLNRKALFAIHMCNMRCGCNWACRCCARRHTVWPGYADGRRG